MFVQKVALKEIKFFAFHGFYPEEQLIGNHFLVDVEVSFIPLGESSDLASTVNYEAIQVIVEKFMKKTEQLLEAVVKNILDELLQSYPYLISATVGIKKMHPPMPGEIGCSFVELSFTK